MDRSSLDNTIGDIQYALRSFRRTPLASLTIVVTVSLGLGVVAVLFTILNTFLFRVDRVPNVGEMYAVERPQQATDGPTLFTRARFDALRAETHVFTDAYAAVNGIRSSTSLKGLLSGQSLDLEIASGGAAPVLSIECDHLVAGQEIEFAADL